jgi:hypothetical protein
MSELPTDPLPGDNRIRSLRATKVGNDRVVTEVALYDNHSRPNLALSITDAEGVEVSRSLIMGTIESNVKFTLHIRVAHPIEPLCVTCLTYHDEDHPLDSKTIPVS